MVTPVSQLLAEKTLVCHPKWVTSPTRSRASSRRIIAGILGWQLLSMPLWPQQGWEGSQAICWDESLPYPVAVG